MLYFAFNMRGQTAVTDSTKVQNCSLTEEINLSSSFAFNMHSTDPAYSIVWPKITYITVYDDIYGDVIFRGRVTTTAEDSSTGMKSVTCNDALIFLNDSFYTNKDAVQGNHIYMYLSYLTKNHNDMVENDSWRSFVDTFYIQTSLFSVIENPQAGKNPHDEWWYEYNGSSYSRSADTSVVSGKTYYASSSLTTTNNNGYLTENLELTGKSSFEVLRTIAESIHWEFKLGYLPSTPHYKITMAPYFGFKSRTPIATGLNLKNLTKERDFGEFYTRIFPVGGYCFDERRLKLYSPNDYADNSSDNVPPSVQWHDAIDNVMRNQYVDNVRLVNKYGIYPKYVVYDDIVANTAEDLRAARHNLYVAAYKDAQKLNDRKETIKINGYDLYKAGYPMDELKVSNYYQCIDTVTGTVIKARLKKKTTYFDKPYEPSLTLEYDGIDTESEVK